MPMVSNSINNFFDFSSANSIKEIRKLETELSKLLKTSKSVAAQIGEIGSKKINLSLNTKGIEENIKGVSKNIKSLGTDAAKTMEQVSGTVSKLDNNMSSRGKKGEKNFSKVNDIVGSFATRAVDTFLSSSESSAVSGAASGAAIGLALGNPIVAVAGAIIGAGAEWALSEVKKETDKKKQRIGVASNIITTYLPKIAMSSVDYASNMEQSRISYKNILGENKGNAFVDKMMEASNKNFYEYSDMNNAGKQMLSAGFEQNQTLRIFDAVGNASAGNGGGKEEALQMMGAMKNMKTAGKVTFDNLDVFKNIGVDAYGILADSIEIAGKKTKATKDELKDLISKGVIPADDAIKYLISGLESKYAGMMYKQSQSFSGLISTIKDSANQIILGPLGEGFINGIKPALASFASFFGLGTEGFRNLKDEIYSFGLEVGKLAGGAIDKLRNTFNEFFNNEDFQNASLPDKFIFIFDELLIKADEWYKTGGEKLVTSVNSFFTNLLVRVAENSEFLDAVQNLWLTIVPDNDTMKAMIRKAFFSSKKTNKEKDSSEEGEIIRDVVGYSCAIGLNRVPYDYYPALLHEGEAVLRRTEADSYRKGVGRNVVISKIADTVVVKDETDMYKLADILVSEIEKAGLVYGGAM